MTTKEAFPRGYSTQGRKDQLLEEENYTTSIIRPPYRRLTIDPVEEGSGT
jgi:hypothetical protein